MSILAELAEPVVEKLLKQSEDELYERLGGNSQGYSR